MALPSAARDEADKQGRAVPNVKRRRHGLARYASLFLALVLGLATIGWQAWTHPGQPAHWWHNDKDPRWVQGQIDLDTPASEVWQRIAAVRAWPTLFSDVASFSVRSVSTDAAHWVVRFESRTIGHGEHDYRVELDPRPRSGRMMVDVFGVRATAYVSVTPIDERRSRVSYAIFAEKRGLFGLFVPERALRVNEERLVERTLDDLARVFGAGGNLG